MVICHHMVSKETTRNQVYAGRSTYGDEEETDLNAHEEERQMYPPEGDDTDEEDDLDGETDDDEGHEDEARGRMMCVFF